jgi:hypothetical protein
LVAVIEREPIPAVHDVVRWRPVDLGQWIFEEFRIRITKQTSSRELRAMDHRELSARPRHHGRAEGAIEDSKACPREGGEVSLPRLDEIAQEKGIDPGKIEIWFAGANVYRDSPLPWEPER